MLKAFAYSAVPIPPHLTSLHVRPSRLPAFPLSHFPTFPYNTSVPELFSKQIDATTRYCAVYGHPIEHSASPAMQNAGIAALGLHWRYVAFDVHPDDLAAAISGAMAMKFVGVNLTLPHKVLAVPMVDLLDESARTWGAVNTIRFEARDQKGNWRPLNSFSGPIPDELRTHGFNTDADAIAQSLADDLDLGFAN